MKFDLVKDELSTLLEELMEQFHTIDSHEKAIPQIEMDIFIRNIQKLYENTLFLKKINESKEKLQLVMEKEEAKEVIDEVQVEMMVEEKPEITAEEKPEPIIENREEAVIEEEAPMIAQEIVMEEKPEPIAEYKEETVLEEDKQILAQEIVEEKIEPVINESEVLEKEHTHVVSEQKEEKKPQDNLLDHVMMHTSRAEPSTLKKEIKTSLNEIIEDQKAEADLFSEVKPNSEINDLNEKLADARNTHSIVEKLQNKRIESLKSVIGINDKFYFINELFGGDTQKYDDIIYTLNNFKKLDEAMQYFSTLKYKFAWDEESEPYAKLTHMLERKFNLIDA